MRISRTLFVLLIILIPFISIAQSAKQADDAFKYEQYATALVMYKKAYSKTKNRVEKKRIMFQIAECYRLTKQPKKAEQQYRRLLRAKYTVPITRLYLAEVMRDQEKYQLASAEFKTYIKMVPDDPRGILGLQSCKNAIEWKKNPSRYQVANLSKINSREDDFSPTYGDKKYKSLVFTSSRKDAGNKIDPNTNLAYTALYSTVKDAKGNWAKPKMLDEDGIVNSSNENNGSAVFNRKYNTIYFTRCVVNKNAILGCAIYTSAKRGKIWGEPIVLPIAHDSIRVGHPAISTNEKTMYFASNLPKGYGGRDIWVVKRRRKNKPFDKPRNVGENINTKGDERYPTLKQTRDGHTYLYFSSDGREGIGGWDMYRSELIEGKWTKAENLGFPLNSSSDDFGIVFSASRKLEKKLQSRQVILCEEMGFFSSNRVGGRGRFDIWEFWLPEIFFTLSGTIKDESTLQYLSNSKVQLSGSDGSVLVTTTDQRGYYSFNKEQISKNTTYTLKVTHKGYFGNNGSETTVGRKESEDIILDIKLEPIPPEPIPLPEIQYKLADWHLLPQYQDSLNGLIETMKNNPTIVIELASHTDFRDSDVRNDTLSFRRAKEVVEYLATKGIDPDRMEPKGYGEHQPRTLRNGYKFNAGTYKGVYFAPGTVLTEEYIKKQLRTTKQKEAAHQLNRRTEFRILRDDYVPKNTNDTLNADSKKITINPADNNVPYTTQNDTIYASCIINGNTYTFAFDGPEAELKLSLDVVMGLIKQHKLNKNSFDNEAEAFTEDGTVKDGEKFIVQRMRIGSKTVYDQTAICVHGQSADILLGDDVLTDFSSYAIDEDKKVIILE
jgi:peptidoglycan-associated lipoprotein